MPLTLVFRRTGFDVALGGGGLDRDYGTERVKGKRLSMKNENEARDGARATIEEALGLANDAGLFCDACVKKIDTGRRPVDFCSTCHSVVRIWLGSIIEREYARMNAEQPGRFTTWKEGETTWVKRNW